MNFQFDNAHYFSLVELINEPNIPINSMLKILEAQGISITYHLLSKALDELKRHNILRSTQSITDPVVPGNERMQTEVEANHNPESLGLARQHVFFRGLHSKNDVNLFAKSCDVHPYTHYRTIGLGSDLLSYGQFDIPQQSAQIQDEFYSSLIKKLHAQYYFTMIGERETTSQLNLSYWSLINAEWEFKVFGETDNSLEVVWENLSSPNHYITTNRESILSQLDLLDLNLIRELNINGKIKPVDLVGYYNKDASTISRRMNKIKTQIMDRSTLFYNRYQFDLTLSQIYIGKSQSANSMNKFHDIVEQLLPFRSSLISNQRDFIWILNSSPTIASDLGYFLWTEMSELEVINLNIQHGRSWKYPLYQNNFDEVNKKWNDSSNYLVADPLKALN